MNPLALGPVCVWLRCKDTSEEREQSSNSNTRAISLFSLLRKLYYPDLSCTQSPCASCSMQHSRLVSSSSRFRSVAYCYKHYNTLTPNRYVPQLGAIHRASRQQGVEMLLGLTYRRCAHRHSMHAGHSNKTTYPYYIQVTTAATADVAGSCSLLLQPPAGLVASLAP